MTYPFSFERIRIFRAQGMGGIQELTPKDYIENVVSDGLCTGCGACVLIDGSESSKMVQSKEGPIPEGLSSNLSELARQVCPGRGLHYPELHRAHYGHWDSSMLAGPLIGSRLGYSLNEELRRKASSGGVITSVLEHLFKTGRIDGAFVVGQSLERPLEPVHVLVNSPDELYDKAQSVYVPVSVLDGLRMVEEGKTYAITCVPDQAATLRALQVKGDQRARQVKYVLGPYTGTAMTPACLDAYLHTHSAKREDVTRLRWRDGEWPGNMKIELKTGRTLAIPKVYYNYLIPFFISKNSLLNMDFANEFCDLSVGDAWSPVFEASGGGHSVYVTRSREMESIIEDMIEKGLLHSEEIPNEESCKMHQHMLEFKKRGAYLRSLFRKRLGFPSVDFGFRPSEIGIKRWIVELIISSIFLLSSTALARALLRVVPESILGPTFNRTRLGWKKMSRSLKRKGLNQLVMVEVNRESSSKPRGDVASR